MGRMECNFVHQIHVPKYINNKPQSHAYNKYLLAVFFFYGISKVVTAAAAATVTATAATATFNRKPIQTVLWKGVCIEHIYKIYI